MSHQIGKVQLMGECTIDTILVNIDGFNLLELGHGYFAEAEEEGILHDMLDLLRHGTPPDQHQRSKKEHAVTGELYWANQNSIGIFVISGLFNTQFIPNKKVGYQLKTRHIYIWTLHIPVTGFRLPCRNDGTW